MCRDVVGLRQRPLLLLYYPYKGGSMEEADVDYCYRAFRNGGAVPETQLESCDVLLHTIGGNPVAGYRLAQCIRDFAVDVSFLVPKYAYSAGTLLCFSGNEIRMGHCAGLSPIDITTIENRQSGRDEIPLASIDSYVDFADACQAHAQGVLSRYDIADISPVGSNLLCTLVDQVGALKVGEYHRARTLTGHYAGELLGSYMLAGKHNGSGRRDRIIAELLFGKPVHDFHMDYHLCVSAGLEVQEMDTKESDMTKAVVEVLDRLVEEGSICPQLTDDLRLPVFDFFPVGTP